MSDRPSFLDELKRRKVVRVAIVYGAVAWAVLQVADIVLPALALPEAILTGLVVVLALGFPVALGLPWAFDVTTDGVRRAPQSATSDEAGTTDGPTPAHHWVGWRTLVVAGVLVVVAYIAGRVATRPDLRSAAWTGGLQGDRERRLGLGCGSTGRNTPCASALGRVAPSDRLAGPLRLTAPAPGATSFLGLSYPILSHIIS